MSVLNIALIGCGWVAEWHIEDGLAKLPALFNVIACCDTNIARVRKFAARHGIPRICSSLLEVLDMNDVDVVVICTPPVLHFPMLLESLRVGKHVVCEKPLVASLAEVDTIIEAETRSVGRVMPISQYRFGDGLARVRHVIQSGLAGRHFVSNVDTAKRRDADYYETTWRGKFASELGGVLVTQSIHVHDILLWLLGPVEAAACFKATRVNPIEVEDCAVASLLMRDGSLASLSATLGSARQVTRIRMCFENVTFEKQGYDEQSSHPGDEPWIVIPRNAKFAAEIEAKMEEVQSHATWFARQYALFYEALSDEKPFPVTLADARTSIELITGLFVANDTQRVVRFPIGPDHPNYNGWIPAGVATRAN